MKKLFIRIFALLMAALMLIGTVYTIVVNLLYSGI